MRRIIALGLVAALICLAACRPPGRVVGHELRPRYIVSTDEPIALSTFADLQGNGRDLLVTVEGRAGINSVLKVYEHDGRLLFQIPTQHHIRGIKALSHPTHRQAWLFYTYNEQDSVHVSAVQFDWQNPERHRFIHFEATPRKDDPVVGSSRERISAFHPEKLHDLDKDGRLELLCRLTSGLPSNPRGLIAFDFETGRIKWLLETESNLTGLLLGDLDRNGREEILIASRAEQTQSGRTRVLDGSGGWLAAVDPGGNLLFAEKQFEGAGEVRLICGDPNDEPAPTIFAIHNMWGNRRSVNTISSLLWTGTAITSRREWSTRSSFDMTDENPNLAVFQYEGDPMLLLIERGTGLTLFNHILEKVEDAPDRFISEIRGAEDIDLDGKPEILLRTQDRRFLVLDNELHTLAELKDSFPGTEEISASFVGRGTGIPKGVVIRSERKVVFYGYYNVPWYMLLWRSVLANSPFITLGLLILIGILVWYIIYNWQSIYMIMPGLRAAIVYLRDDDRIQYCNPFFLELVRAPAGKGRKSLKALSPTISGMLMDFKASGDNLQNHELVMGEEHLTGLYRVSLFRRRNPVYRFLIIIVPTPLDPAGEKILWADTARRLSHHVRRHLTNVIMALPRLIDDNVDPSERKEYQQIINSELEKVRVFTHSFQRFSELRDHDLRPHDVTASVEHVLDLLRVPENVKLLRNIPLSPINAFLEPVRLEESLFNLLNNSLDAMPEGGCLQISVKRVAPGESPKSSLTVLIEIEDSGTGIPEENLKEVWQPFFTTKQSGTGIGLPESRKIVESMEGALTLQSEEGVGTVVSLWLRGEGD